MLQVREVAAAVTGAESGELEIETPLMEARGAPGILRYCECEMPSRPIEPPAVIE